LLAGLSAGSLAAAAASAAVATAVDELAGPVETEVARGATGATAG